MNFIKLCLEKIHRADIRFIALGFGNFIFTDVNKRTSRLAANIPFIRAFMPTDFLGVPEQAYSRDILGIYELNRIELLRDLYLWAYERSV